MAFLLLVTCALVTASAGKGFDSASVSTSVAAQFEEFKQLYSRSYTDKAEEDYRLKTFSENLDIAATLTAKSNGSAEFGVTKFSDLTKQEFKSRYLTYSPSEKLAGSQISSPISPHGSGTNKSKWSWYGNLTTRIKDQGQCGSCWAFSATEQTESMAIKAGKLQKTEPLAVQQIVSCDKNKDEGCNGGDTKTAYKYIIKAGGLEAEKSYPYTSGVTGMTGWCLGRDDKAKVVDIEGWSVVGHLNEEVMLKYVSNEAPLSICVDASSWQTYKRGVITRATCGLQIDHCVQLTGFDFTHTEFREKAWLVRNSWNTDWGMKGFIALEYGTNTCAIHNEPTTVTIKA
jgi:C1A family cysteine protease